MFLLYVKYVVFSFSPFLLCADAVVKHFVTCANVKGCNLSVEKKHIISVHYL